MTMSRSKKKGPFVATKLLRKVLKQEETGAHEPIRTWSRACQIVPEFVGHVFEVHNGKDFIKVSVNENMVGHRLGEFAPTRKFRGHRSGK
jgi:small subunit ribosomal protein S19